jgi:hypothetical protein
VAFRQSSVDSFRKYRKWFQTATMRIDRFHTYWRGSQSSARQWLRRFRHHYNHERPNQALDGKTPAEVIQNYTVFFVSYQAVRSYLTEYRNAEYEGSSDEERLNADRETIQRFSSRTLSVTEGGLETLRETGRMDIGEFEVLLDLQVLCQSCGVQHSIEALFEQSGCDCERME